MTDRIRSTIVVNGELRQVVAAPAATLLGVLRDQLDLTGSKFNCEQGECGACTVLLDGRATNACLVLAATAEGHEVTTVEGIGSQGLNLVQEAFLACDAAQCGYCTPGMVVSATALLQRTTTPSKEDVEESIAGNYCRCTGYESIVHAIHQAAQKERAR